MRPTAVLAFLVLLSACERKAEAPLADDAKPGAAAAAEVAAADAFGPAGEAVADVAFWSHPSVNFESRLLATVGPRVVAYNIETGEEESTGLVDGPAGAIGVFYDGVGAAAQGYALVSNGLGYSAFAIDNKTAALIPVPVAGPDGAASRFCVGRRAGGAALYEVGAASLDRRAITIGSQDLVIGAPQPLAAIERALSCAVDDRSGAVIAVSADGAVRRIDPETGASFGLTVAEGFQPASAAIVLMTVAEGDDASGGAIALLDGAAGAISLFDLADGHALGVIRVKSTFDLEGVKAATAISAGAGNYGGVYRDGALAVIADGDQTPPIRLVPWNGVLGALQLPLGENVDPRTPAPVTEDETVIDIGFIEP